MSVHGIDAANRSRLLGLFVAESQEQLAQLDHLADLLRADEAETALANEFGQMAHGMKGAASALELAPLAGVLHALEQLALEVAAAHGPARTEQHRRLVRSLQLLHAEVSGLTARGGALSTGIRGLQELLGILAPATAPSADIRPTEASERLSVPAAEVDEALRLASALARSVMAAGDGWAGELGGSAERLETLLLNFRLLPAEEVFAGFEAEVERLADRLGKEVLVELAGGDVRADRGTLQAARGMVRHLIRNALDHGIEAPQTRMASGKSRAGTLRVSLTMDAAWLTVEVKDDGAGFDVAAFRQKLGPPSERMSDEQVLQTFASRGGSTRESATDISGRGLGLSAVVALASGRGGSLTLRSERGVGSQVCFTLPLEAYTLDVLTVRCGGHSLGIPLTAVEHTLVVGAGGARPQITPSGTLLAVGERIVRYVPLAPLLDVGLDTQRPARFAVVVGQGGDELALGVDELGEPRRVLPQVAAPAIHAQALVTGVVPMREGPPLQILSASALLAAARSRSSAVQTPAARPPRARLEVLLADDSLATREVLRVLLEQEGFSVRVAGDGEEALAQIGEALPDVLVTDLNMPRCDGLMLTRALRSAARTSKLPVVLLTSQEDDASMAEGRRSGVDAYLLKSKFNARLLHETLQRLGVEA